MSLKPDHCFNQPFFLTPNRVRRSFQGGFLLERFRGYPRPADGDTPEDWVASVTASNTGHDPDEGLSFLQSGPESIRLRDLIGQYPREILGENHFQKYGPDPFLLVKLLDSQVRLRLQVHPDRRKARELLHAEHGKTEAWMVMETRNVGAETPYIILGFKEGVTKAAFQKAIFGSDPREMMAMLHRIAVKPGDIYYIQGGTPHAIGPGVFMVEVQEPSDYTIFVEPKGKNLRDEGPASHLGLGWEAAFDCFHYEGASERDIVDRWRIVPQTVRSEGGGTLEALLYGPAIDPYFGAERLTVKGGLTVQYPGFYIAIVIRGAGRIVTAGGTHEVARGQTLFMPVAAGAHQWECLSPEALEIILCHPPRATGG
jgi:mannose-6-phosphate isomerase